MKILLGSKVRDTVTGFTGVVESRHEYLDGYVSFGVRAPWNQDGKENSPSVTISEKYLEVVQ